MKEVVLQPGHERSERDQHDRGGATEVRPHHDLLAVHAIRDDARRRREQHRGHGVRQERDRHRCAAAGDLEGENDQREEKELVRQLRSCAASCANQMFLNAVNFRTVRKPPGASTGNLIGSSTAVRA